MTLVLVSTVSDVAAPPPGNPNYSLGINPSNPIGLGGTVVLTVTESGGSKNSAYTLAFGVQKPNGTGMALESQVLATDNRGAGQVSVQYPSSSWTALSGTVNTDVGGVYNVVVNQTGPTNTGTVATGQFVVTSQLTVVISQPVMGTTVQRGQSIAISVTVSSSLGGISGATVTANTPSNGQLVIPQSGGIGIYSATYQVLVGDPVGSWVIVVSARDASGNTGASLPITVNVAKSSLFVDSMVAYNSKGVPSTSFSPGDTIFSYFRIRYTGSSGAFLTTGQYLVAIMKPSGAIALNLTAVYDANRLGFYSPTGYTISSFDPGGSWKLAINPNTIDDGYGNTGPQFSTSVRVDIVVITSPLDYLPFILGGLVALGGGIFVLKRYDTTLEGFEHLEQMIGGPIPRGSSLLLIGDPGSGKTVLSYELLHDELEAGRPCALLSYDAFPEDVQARMGEFGWDIISHLRKGRLKIIDCYSGLAGQGEGALRDPSDLTELNIQVTSFITKAKSVPVTLILDSLTPIFNGVEAKQAINFLQTVGAKVKKTGGLFVLTASKGAVPEDAIAKIKSIMDGVIELTLVRSGRKAHRYLTIMKMERRRISSDTASFEIERGLGVVFRVSRFGILHRKLRKIDMKDLVPLSKRNEGIHADGSKVETGSETKHTDERARESRKSESQPKPFVGKPR